jgi:dihydroorotate dehydrogenase
VDDALDDYARSFAAVHPVADFVVVNVSSPNTKGLRALQTADVAKRLFERLQTENRTRGSKPLLVKVAPDLDDDGYDALLAAVTEAGLAGVIATNTSIKREGLRTPANEIARIGDGGLSGPPLATRARAMVKRAREVLGGEATVIGVGGIETADDVIEMLRAGADLVQMYTGFIYGGPFIARAIAQDLVTKLSAANAPSLAALVSRTESPYR